MPKLYPETDPQSLWAKPARCSSIPSFMSCWISSRVSVVATQAGPELPPTMLDFF
jgi:hypothetical protein